MPLTHDQMPRGVTLNTLIDWDMIPSISLCGSLTLIDVYISLIVIRMLCTSYDQDAMHVL